MFRSEEMVLGGREREITSGSAMGRARERETIPVEDSAVCIWRDRFDRIHCSVDILRADPI